MNLITALFIAGMAVWVQRTAFLLKGRIDRAATLPGRGAGRMVVLAGLTALLVAREGAEIVMMLRASAQGLWWQAAGVVLGGAVAVMVGMQLARGSRDLARLLRVSGVVLWGLVAWFVIAGAHELGEAGILPVGPREMALIGPVVSHSSYVFAALLLVCMIAMWSTPQGWSVVRVGAAVGGAGLLIVHGWTQTLPPAGHATLLAVSKEHVRVPIRTVGRTPMFFSVALGKKVIRFFALRRHDGVVLAIDGCRLCGSGPSNSYAMRDARLICRHCGAEIEPWAIGVEGGCTPVYIAGPFDPQQAVVLSVEELGASAARVGLVEVAPDHMEDKEDESDE